MKVDPRALQIRLTRGRTQPIALRVGSLIPDAPTPTGSPSLSWSPIDITGWAFAFTLRTNFTLKQPTVAVTYNPVVNQADPTQGQLLFNILAADLKPLTPGNYVFDIALTLPGQDPSFFCSGTAPLYDNVTDIP